MELEQNNAVFPTITVLTDTRNNTEGLKRCIETIKNQDYQGELIHLILIDDCEVTTQFLAENYDISNHLTWFEMIREEGNNTQNLFQILTQQLIDFSWTDWVSLISDDCECHPTHFRLLHEAIVKQQASVACSSLNFIINNKTKRTVTPFSIEEDGQITLTNDAKEIDVKHLMGAFLLKREILIKMRLYQKINHNRLYFKWLNDLLATISDLFEKSVVNSQNTLFVNSEQQNRTTQVTSSYEKPNQEDIAFYINVYHDIALLKQAIIQLRKVYPKAKLILRSDGDTNSTIREIAEKYNALCFYGDNLMPIENGGKIVSEMLRLFLEHTSCRYLFKIDPDTKVFNQFQRLPLSSTTTIFGTVQHQKSLFSIQGGCIGFTRKAAKMLHDTAYFLNPEFAKSVPPWAITKPLLNRPFYKKVTSFDWLIGWACRERKLRMVSLPKIYSNWIVPPPLSASQKYAVAHPYKLTPNIKCSIILCTKNRAEALEQRLRSLNTNSIIQNNIDLVLIDNGSTDATPFVIKNYADTADFEVQTATVKEQGISFARNEGIKRAKGELLIFTDDDCYMQEDYIKILLETFDIKKMQYCGGRILLWDNSDAMESINYSNEYKGLSANSFIHAGFLQGANMVIHRSVFDKINGFDVSMGAGTNMRCEDIEFLGRASINGFEGAYLPQLVVYHHHRRKYGEELEKLRQVNDIGRGAYYAAMFNQGFALPWTAGLKMSKGYINNGADNPQRIVNELEGAKRYFISRVGKVHSIKKSFTDFV